MPPYEFGVRRTKAPTIRCTTGRTTSKTGKAIIHELAQALNQAETMPGAKPMLFAVDTPETMQDMMIEVISSATAPP
jgi:hypothetical protein